MNHDSIPPSASSPVQSPGAGAREWRALAIGASLFVVLLTPSIAETPMPAPIDVFFSYSHKDEALRDELATHLKLLERAGVIRSWHDRRIGHMRSCYS